MSNLGGKNVSEDTDKDLSVDSIVAGTNIDNIDSTDPRNPIINAAAGAGQTNTASNVGGETGELFKQKTGSDLEFKTLKQGSRVTLTNNASDVEIAADLQLKNTTKGDLEVFTTVAARLAVGTDTQVLTADSGEASGVKWATPSAGGAVATDVIWDAKGDLAGGTGADTAVKLTVGTNDQVLTADSAEATGMKWATPAAGSATFHGALITRPTNLARTASGLQQAFTVEDYDTDSFVDLGTDDDRITIPANVTKVQVSGFMDCTDNTGGKTLSVLHYNSSDAVIRRYETANNTNGLDPTLYLTTITPIIEVSSGDYFALHSNSSDTSWTQTYAALGLEYKDGTL